MRQIAWDRRTLALEESVKSEARKEPIKSRRKEEIDDRTKMPQEHMNLIEKSSDRINIAVSDKTSCCEEVICLISPREEIVVVTDILLSLESSIE